MQLLGKLFLVDSFFCPQELDHGIHFTHTGHLGIVFFREATPSSWGYYSFFLPKRQAMECCILYFTLERGQNDGSVLSKGVFILLEVTLQQAFQTTAVAGLIMEHIKKY
jgi:hypothetical protein